MRESVSVKRAAQLTQRAERFINKPRTEHEDHGIVTGLPVVYNATRSVLRLPCKFNETPALFDIQKSPIPVLLKFDNKIYKRELRFYLKYKRRVLKNSFFVCSTVYLRESIIL